MVRSSYGGERVSGYSAFIKPIEDAGGRASLTIHRYSNAEKVLLHLNYQSRLSEIGW